MLFSSLHFLLFFLPLFFLCYFAVKKRRGRNLMLFLFSLLFYAWGEPLYVFPVEQYCQPLPFDNSSELPDMGIFSQVK